MASSLGSLVVSLGLDAAEYVSGLSKSEYQARAFANSVTGAFTRAAGAIGAIGASVGGALAILGEAAGQIAAYQDLADQIGATAEEVAGLQLAADLSGKSLDQVAAASVKLTAALSKADDEGKGVGAALAAINIPIKEFKQLDPVAQLERVADALAGFEDGAGKTAVAVALFGRSGAELIPFLNDLAETGGRQLRLTAEQIAAADEYAKAYDRLKGEAKGLAQVFVAESIPAAVGLLGALNDVAGSVLGLGRDVGALARDNGIRAWAEGAALALGTVLESLTFVAKAARALAGSFEAVWADLKVAGGFAARGGVFGLFSAENRAALAQSLEARNKVVADANKRYADLWSYNGTALTDAMRARFAQGPAGAGGTSRPRLNFAVPGAGEGAGGGAGGRGGSSATSAATRYLENLQKQLEATQNLSVEEQLLQDIRLGRLGKVTAAQADELAGIARTIDQVRAQREQDAALARETIERMNEERAAREKAQSDAARLYEQTRTPLEALNIEEARLNQLLADGLISWDTYARGIFKANEAYDSALDQSKKLTAEQERAQSMAKELGMTFSSAFEDAIVGGKGLSEVLKGLEQDVIRIITRKMVTKPLADALGGMLEGSSGGGKGSWMDAAGAWVASLFGGGRAGGGPVQSGRFYRVNERGSELLSVNGRDYLMAGANGRVSPVGAGGGVTVNMTVVARDAESFRRSEGQIASRLSGIASRGGRFA